MDWFHPWAEVGKNREVPSYVGAKAVVKRGRWSLGCFRAEPTAVTTRAVCLVSNQCMKIRWRVALPCIGLLLFALISIQSFQWRAPNSRYLRWSGISLDSQPRSQSRSACKDGTENCSEWGSESIVDPGVLGMALVVSALPAFFLDLLIVHAFRLMGLSDVYTFMISMPLLLGGWYYLLGRLVERLACKST
jgi:hypothetical protein